MTSQTRAGRFLGQFLQAVRGFRSATGANVATTFALATIPIIGFVGSAIDYSRANATRTAMQSALDATALMLSKNAATMTPSQVTSSASAYFNALFTRPEAKNVQISAVYSTTSGSQVVLSGSATVNTNFMALMGYDSLAINATSTAKWGSSKLRVTLVLDITGSMASDGKMTAMKTATKNLLNQLKTAASKDGDVYVSIVPFNKDVNLNTSNYSANWIDWTEWEAEPPYMSTWLANSTNQDTWEQTGPGSDCPFSNRSNQPDYAGFTCTSGPANNASSASTIPSSGSYSGYICPGIDSGKKIASKGSVYYNGCYDSKSASRTVSTGSNASCGSKPNCTCSNNGNGNGKKCTQNYYTHTWVKNARSTWNGCVADRGKSSAPSTANYDTNVTTPVSSNVETLYPAEQFSSCSVAAVGLNYSWSSMTSMVDSLSPVGNTNQGIGLQLGWMSLVGGGPFTMPAKDANYKYNEVIILMSDGENTQNRWSSTQSAIDAREALTCSNAKAAGFTIYAVQVNTGGDPTQAVMRNCATDSTKFFELKKASDLITTFDSIGTALSNLRIAN